MIPEIQLLNTHFADKEWNNENQIAFMELLRDEYFFFLAREQKILHLVQEIELTVLLKP